MNYPNNVLEDLYFKQGSLNKNQLLARTELWNLKKLCLG